MLLSYFLAELLLIENLEFLKHCFVISPTPENVGRHIGMQCFFVIDKNLVSWQKIK